MCTSEGKESLLFHKEANMLISLLLHRGSGLFYRDNEMYSHINVAVMLLNICLNITNQCCALAVTFPADCFRDVTVRRFLRRTEVRWKQQRYIWWQRITTQCKSSISQGKMRTINLSFEFSLLHLKHHENNARALCWRFQPSIQCNVLQYKTIGKLNTCRVWVPTTAVADGQV